MYTGEGFKGEKFFAGLTAVTTVLTLISTVLLISLTIKQHKHTDLQLDEIEKKKQNTN